MFTLETVGTLGTRQFAVLQGGEEGGLFTRQFVGGRAVTLQFHPAWYKLKTNRTHIKQFNTMVKYPLYLVPVRRVGLLIKTASVVEVSNLLLTHWYESLGTEYPGE